MPTGYLLVDQPNPNYPQYRNPRRNGAKATGTSVVHTFESAPDWVGPDTGVERAVEYLQTRSDPGCYHSACDSDSTLRLVPWWFETWHDTATNNFSIGVSIATKAHKWLEAPETWRRHAVVNCAREFARIHDELYQQTGIDVPAVLLTRSQAHAARPGFIGHGVTGTMPGSDPGRRSDPGAAFDWSLFLATYRGARTNGRYAAATEMELAAHIKKEDRMFIVEAKGSRGVYLMRESGPLVALPNTATINAWRAAGVETVTYPDWDSLKHTLEQIKHT